MDSSFSQIVCDPQIQQKRHAAFQEKRARFELLSSHLFSTLSHTSVGQNKRKQVAGHLKTWIEKASWSQCDTCICLSPQILKPSFAKRIVATRPTCNYCPNAAPKLSAWPGFKWCLTE
uniref:uncharacterized protein LOC108950812 n=1 Tax=Ciona intestinalis TaxID=7719 RepID=UPI000EF4578C|nr:uncharacterized protein LOC108950812 [Ciona intestinalis]|eukprot:XP_026695639.1 uncharacterized protein LOC108950812 [Ciona intestinalis]